MAGRLADVFRPVNPSSPQELPLRILFQPAGGGVFYRACEADSYRALVAALLGDPGYEEAAVADRLQARVRMAEDLLLIHQLEDRQLRVTDRDTDDAINIHSDEEFIQSLERIGFLSLAAGMT